MSASRKPMPSAYQLMADPPDTPTGMWPRSSLIEHTVSLVQNAAVLKAIVCELGVIQAAQDVAVSEINNSDGPAFPADELRKDDRLSNVAGLAASLNLRGDNQSGFAGDLRAKVFEELYNSWPQSGSLAAQAAQHMLDILNIQVKPLEDLLVKYAEHGRKSTLATLVSKRQKLLRNRKWRTKKRRRTAETLQKARDLYDDADREADDWRTQELAKSIVKRKMQSMKTLAERKAKEGKNRRQQEVETVVLVEKLQELRVLRVAKLKKQGRFFPEEDDQFMEKVRAAVAEEERQAAAAANHNATAAAILNAEEARKAATVLQLQESSEKCSSADAGNSAALPELEHPKGEISASNLETWDISGRSPKVMKHSGLLEVYEGLPVEFHHYYVGSNFDLGTLIEVRQGWDAFIGRGGSRIPQHWIEPPRPSDATWASCLVQVDVETRRRR